ncbi:MAG TPA: ABC transporter substrate-binding protein [Methylomirabilota bacterium]|nr:ABC transporter substrate-binding protein [Methylomirabilota bacterium]
MAAITLAVFSAPLAVEPQSPPKPGRLGLLYDSTPAFAPDTDFIDGAIAEGLRNQGYVVGQNLVVEFRSALTRQDRYPTLAAELVRAGVDVIVTGTEPGVRAARDASRTIPIVMAGASIDPVAAGLIASLAPGWQHHRRYFGGPRRQAPGTARETLPGLRSVAAVHGDPNVPFVAQWLHATEAAARRLGLTLHPVLFLGQDAGHWDQVFASVARRPVGAVTIHEAPRFEMHHQVLADLALKHRLPMVFTFRNQAEAGGLMAYSADEPEIWRRAGNLVARILKGARPADLPVEEPTLYQFAVNLRTAKALGLTIPPSVLARATELIQ